MQPGRSWAEFSFENEGHLPWVKRGPRANGLTGAAGSRASYCETGVRERSVGKTEAELEARNDPSLESPRYEADLGMEEEKYSTYGVEMTIIDEKALIVWDRYDACAR